MKYRDAKRLKKGDFIVRKTDSLLLQIDSVEVFGQYKKVKFTCKLPANAGGSQYVSGTTYVSIYNEEAE